MKFTKLRLLGFKSFVEPTEFVIESGLTGVVGPNGCGKSNLVEAMRWVMGENSYKNMRASGMDDVIFSGSGTRPARNSAEVGLFLDNSTRTAPAAFNDADEIQVTRRIERESGSVYRINGREARAKDVQLLFADASTGARSPSMVGQGRIGELIQAKPQARRQLLEEAAGISGLHSRRHEAELRMRAAETNLERLEDVTSELTSQIESLKRQARQANRFRALSADIREAEATLLHARWVVAREAEVEADAALTTTTSAVAEAAQAQMEAAKAQAIAAHKLPDLRDNEARAAAALQRLQMARTQIDEEAERVARRRSEIDRRLAQLDEDIARDAALIADNAGILDRLDGEERERKERLAGSGQRAERLKAAMDGAAATLSGSEAALQEATAERAEAAAARGQLDRTLRELSERVARLDRQIADADRELAEIAERIGRLPDPLERQRALSLAEESLQAAREALSGWEAAVEAARAEEVRARPPVDAARAALSAAETEARTIARMLDGGAGSGRFRGVVESMAVTRGLEAALGAALGDGLDQPADATAPAHWVLVPAAPDDPALPAGLTSLATAVSAPPELARALAQIGVIEDEADGPALQSRLLPGQCVVARSGALWRWDGFVAGADAPTAAALRLAQKNRLAELEGEREAARAARDRAQAVLAAAEAATRAAVEAERGARDTVKRAEAALSAARAELAEAERAAGALSGRRDVLAAARAQVAAQRSEAIDARKAAEAAMASAPDLAGLDARLREASAAVGRQRTALADARAAHDGFEREVAANSRRIAAIAGERRSWLERAAGAESHIAALRIRRDEAASEARAMADAPDEIAANRRRLMSQLSEAESLRRKAADMLAEAETRARGCDRTATEAIATLSQRREERGRAEERLMAARERRGEAEARIREVLHCDPHEARRLTGLKAGEPLPEIAEVERRLDRLKVERERLGAVNLRAEEEQAELVGRLDTIVVEREDVIEAIRKLRSAILELNKEGRERLLAAFDVVNDQFKRLFTHLFGGGTAELQLIESDDPLDAGLEIVARPPGKKPQTMTLLSGGEQALTAMALIFAVFLTNPAPICVLDEVDAPLDDHNVERYCNLMEEMTRSTETRFVIITHNPITMARMNRLFGVTMAEQGVSQLVSVDLETAEQLREAV